MAKPRTFTSGKTPTGVQAPRMLTGKVKQAVLPATTKPSMNMGKNNPKKTSGGSKGTLGGGAGGL